MPTATPTPVSGPVISGVDATNVTTTTADITWHVSEPATGQTEYGTTTSYGSFSTRESSFDYQDHIQAINGLKAGTVYHFRVTSTDQDGNTSVSADRDVHDGSRAGDHADARSDPGPDACADAGRHTGADARPDPQAHPGPDAAADPCADARPHAGAADRMHGDGACWWKHPERHQRGLQRCDDLPDGRRELQRVL